MLERLARNEYYCFLDGFSGYFQIPIDPLDQEKTTFTCPYGTFAYRRMPFGLCNAPGTFQRCMVGRHQSCAILEKCHFMVKEGIVLGHKISRSGIEVDRAKDFSKIDRPMNHLLEKETPFIFSKECIEAFETLKMKLTQAPILVAPDWDLPFEIMCDASDFVVGAVLGQRKTKHFQPIHYASKTMTEHSVYGPFGSLKYLLAKQDAKPRLLRLILLLQEFDVVIRDKQLDAEKSRSADHYNLLRS
ncbi:reverse transcriptase domain-containing protein [Tanacetum coccineum]